MATSKDTDFAGSALPRDDLVARQIFRAQPARRRPSGGQVTTIVNLEQHKQADWDGAEQRSGQGVLTLSKAAALIVNRGGASEQHVWHTQFEAAYERLHAAAGEGQLRMRHPETLLVEDFNDWVSPSQSELVATIDDLNAWLETSGVPYRVGDQAPTRAPVSPASNVVSMTQRRDVLWPLIEAAQAACGSPFDAAKVWASMCEMADRKPPPAPLVGRDEEGNLKYRKGDADEFGSFKRKDLTKRLKRACA